MTNFAWKSSLSKMPSLWPSSRANHCRKWLPITSSSSIRTASAWVAPVTRNAADATACAVASVISPAGGDQPHNNMQPYLTFYFNIALQGVFPPRG